MNTNLFKEAVNNAIKQITNAIKNTAQENIKNSLTVAFVDKDLQADKSRLSSSGFYTSINIDNFRYMSSLLGRNSTDIENLHYPQNLYDYLDSMSDDIAFVYIIIDYESINYKDFVGVIDNISQYYYTELYYHPDHELIAEYIQNCVPNIDEVLCSKDIYII